MAMTVLMAGGNVKHAISFSQCMMHYAWSTIIFVGGQMESNVGFEMHLLIGHWLPVLIIIPNAVAMLLKLNARHYNKVKHIGFNQAIQQIFKMSSNLITMNVCAQNTS